MLLPLILGLKSKKTQNLLFLYISYAREKQFSVVISSIYILILMKGLRIFTVLGPGVPRG